jgi:hypothetical protein
MFQPKREEVTGDWRKLLNEELHNLCCSPNIIEMRNARTVLTRKSERKSQTARRKCKWEDNIKWMLK